MVLSEIVYKRPESELALRGYEYKHQARLALSTPPAAHHAQFAPGLVCATSYQLCRDDVAVRAHPARCPALHRPR